MALHVGSIFQNAGVSEAPTRGSFRFQRPTLSDCNSRVQTDDKWRSPSLLGEGKSAAVVSGTPSHGRSPQSDGVRAIVAECDHHSKMPEGLPAGIYDTARPYLAVIKGESTCGARNGRQRHQCNLPRSAAFWPRD
jgi:hypothetical protein